MAVRISEKYKFEHFYLNRFCSINVSNDFCEGNNVFELFICNFVPLLVIEEDRV